MRKPCLVGLAAPPFRPLRVLFRPFFGWVLFELVMAIFATQERYEPDPFERMDTASATTLRGSGQRRVLASQKKLAPDSGGVAPAHWWLES